MRKMGSQFFEAKKRNIFCWYSKFGKVEQQELCIKFQANSESLQNCLLVQQTDGITIFLYIDIKEYCQFHSRNCSHHNKQMNNKYKSELLLKLNWELLQNHEQIEGLKKHNSRHFAFHTISKILLLLIIQAFKQTGKSSKTIAIQSFSENIVKLLKELIVQIDIMIYSPYHQLCIEKLKKNIFDPCLFQALEKERCSQKFLQLPTPNVFNCFQGASCMFSCRLLVFQIKKNILQHHLAQNMFIQFYATISLAGYLDEKLTDCRECARDKNHSFTTADTIRLCWKAFA